jgi:hypothetical protein
MTKEGPYSVQKKGNGLILADFLAQADAILKVEIDELRLRQG